MGSPSVDKRCPHCGEWTPAAMPRCRVCGELEGDRRGPPPLGEKPLGAEDFLLPRNVSIWSMLACYVGLMGCLLPVAGFFLGVLATGFAVIALLRRRQGVTYHSVTSDLRAVFGLIFGISAMLVWGYVLVSLIVSSRK